MPPSHVGPRDRQPVTGSQDDFATWWRTTGERELRQLLYWAWDPIGVNGAFAASAGEYDSYGIEIATALASGATPTALGRLLHTIERDRMGLAVASPEAVAIRLHDWYRRSRATPSRDLGVCHAETRGDVRC